LPGTELTSKGELLSKEEKKVHRSGVGKLLFLMRYSRPDILHIMRELSKWMSDRATINHKKVIQQTIKHIIRTKNCRLCLRPDMIINNLTTDYIIIKG